MSKDYISPEHAIRNIMNDKRQAVNEEQQLDEFKVKTPKLPEIPDIKVKPDLPEVKPTETPNVKPDGKTKVDPETSGKVRTDADIDAKAKKDVKTKTPEAEAPKGKDSGKKKTDTADAKPKKVKTPFLPGITPGQPIAMMHGAVFGVGDYVHMAGERLGEENGTEERTKIEYVPRSKRKDMGRQQSVEKQITEKRKETIKKVLKSETIVDQNPQTNDEPNEVNEGWKKNVAKRVASVGLGGAIGGAGYKAGAEKTVDKPDRSEKKDLMGLSNKEYGGVDVALDLASMAPFIGTPAALASAARSFQRGDYVDTGLDLVSAIPGLGTLIKGVKMGKKYGRIAKMVGKPKLDKLASRVIGKETPARAAVGVPVHKAGIGASDVATGAQLGDIGYKINQAAGQTKSEFEKLQKDPKWKKLSPEVQKNVSDAYSKQSTFTGVASDVAKSMGSDLKRDIYNPIKSRVKKTVDQLGIGEEYLYETKGGKKIKAVSGVRGHLTPKDIKALESIGIKFDKDGKIIFDNKIDQPAFSPAELKAARSQPEGGARNKNIKDNDGIDTNGSKKTDKPEADAKPADVSNKVKTDTTLPSGKPAGASTGGWSPTQKRPWAAGLRPGAGVLGAGALAAGLVGLGSMSDNNTPESSSSDTAAATATPSTAVEPGQRKEDEMRKALKKQAADALNKKPGEQHPGVGDTVKPTVKEPKAEKKPVTQTSKPAKDLTWSGYSAQKVATKGQGARQELAKSTQDAAWAAAGNKNLSRQQRVKAAFLAKRLQDQEYGRGR